VIALFEARRAGLYARAHWLPNILAGVVVGVVALPLSMAFAIASGARPEQGLYTAIVAGVLVSLLGGSRVQIAGPTGAFIALLAGITATHGIGGLQVATLLAGVMLLGMGLARLGGVIRFIPLPVIAGFTAGIGVIIFVSQWRDFLGLPEVGGAAFHEKVWNLVQALPQAHGATIALGAGSLALLVVAPRVPGLKRVPGPLVAMVVATVVQALVDLPGVATIGSAFGGIPLGIPSFTWPEITLPQVLTLIGPAFTIAMLGAIESLLSASVADGMAGTRHEPNQELVGQGIANIAAPLFGGFAATGAIARTATGIRNGATSPVCGVVHAATLVAVLLVAAPLAAQIPLAALSAILFVVAWNMSDLKGVAGMLRRAPLADRAVLLITFLLTVFVDLVVAVNVGVILAILHFLKRMAESVDVQAADTEALSTEGVGTLPEGVRVFEIAGPLFFGAVDKLQQVLLATPAGPGQAVIRLRSVPFADMTGIRMLEEVVRRLRERGVEVRFCEANPRVLEKLRRAGLIPKDGGSGYAPSLRQAVSAREGTTD